MSASTVRRMSWSVGLVSIALIIGGLVLMFIDRHVALPDAASSGRWNFSNVLSAVVNIAVPVTGIMLASRRPENTIGWLFLAAGSMLGIGAFGLSYGVHALLADPGSFPAGRLLVWVANWVGPIPLGVLAFLFLLFPTGHLRSARWRPVAWFVGSAFTLVMATNLTFSTLAWAHPFAQTSGNVLLGLVLFALLLGALAASIAALVARFRGSVGDERLQMKWFVAEAVVVFATFVVSFFSPSSNSSSSSAAISVIQSLAFVFLWTAIAVAVLKYRLYDIDVVINRAVVYGSLAVFITLVYVGLVVGVGTLVGHRGSPLLSAVAAALIARVPADPRAQPALRQPDRLREAGDTLRGAVGLRRADGRHVLRRRGAAADGAHAGRRDGGGPFRCVAARRPGAPGRRLVAGR
jgi:hypothetical protein